MNDYHVIVRSTAGLLESLRIAAPDAAGASSRASRGGAQVLACTPAAEPAARPGVALTRRAPGLDLAAFAHELASLLAAGLSVLQSLQTLATAAHGSAVGSDLALVAQRVTEGLTLSAAMDLQGARFPALLVATIRASEQTGNLAEALQRYAEHQQRVRALRDKVVGAAIYPALLLVLGSSVVLFLLLVVVPRFATLIESTRQELPWTSKLLMSWGHGVADHQLPAVLLVSGLLIALGLGARQLVRSGGRASWVQALPILGPLIREFRHTQLYRTTGMLVQGGIPLPKALSLCDMLLSHDDRSRLLRALELIREGLTLSDALQDTGIADPVSTGMLSVAERSGDLAAILERIALFKESRLQRSVDWASRLVEPALMVVIGLVIGAIVVLMYLPIFDLASSLQ
jgi:general secretion pathway protein F